MAEQPIRPRFPLWLWYFEGRASMASREDLMEALDAIETGMCRIKESRDIWQNELVYALGQGVRLLLTEELRHGRQ